MLQVPWRSWKLDTNLLPSETLLSNVTNNNIVWFLIPAVLEYAAPRIAVLLTASSAGDAMITVWFIYLFFVILIHYFNFLVPIIVARSFRSLCGNKLNLFWPRWLLAFDQSVMFSLVSSIQQFLNQRRLLTVIPCSLVWKKGRFLSSWKGSQVPKNISYQLYLLWA